MPTPSIEDYARAMIVATELLARMNPPKGISIIWCMGRASDAASSIRIFAARLRPDGETDKFPAKVCLCGDCLATIAERIGEAVVKVLKAAGEAEPEGEMDIEFTLTPRD